MTGPSFVARLTDTALDRSVVLGYSAIGAGLRRHLSTWPADPPADALAGKHALVTGASSGLGIATAEGLADLGAHVHLVVRDLAKARGVLDAPGGLRELFPDTEFSVWRCDVSDLDDVRRFAGEFLDAGHPANVLVHNAGAMPPLRTESAQGHEMTLALHVLGPVAMTEALREPLSRGQGRVIMVTSGGMYTQRLPVDDLEFEHGEYQPPTAYARTKRVQVALLPVLAERWADDGITVHATHPGWAHTPGVVDSLPGFHRITRPILRDAEQGADTTVWVAASDPCPPSGHLWHDRRIRPEHYLRRTRESAQEIIAVWDQVRSAADVTD
jgi:NAD(P)-dependent dehydrogenase (short-subunit alcohol dehydrogenase family)